MATVNLLRDGSVKAVEVPSTLNSDDDCRVWISYWKQQNVETFDTRLVAPFKTAYDAGSAPLSTIVSMLNDEFIGQDDDAWPVTTTEIRDHCEANGHTLSR